MARVEIIHWKDEEACNITVFVDGEETACDVFTINPDRGYKRSEWDQATEFLCALASPNVARVLRDARNDAADNSPYVEQDNGYH